MKKSESKHRILILGASGFLGNAIYKELCAYFKTFGTYARDQKDLEKNRHFFQYKLEEDDIYEILESVKPSIIISCLRGDFSAQILAHKHLTEYVKDHDCRVLFLSSSNVFDAYSKFPSYENDTTFSNSIYGHFKIKIENMIMRLPKRKWAILRIPMLMGTNSPRALDIKEALKEQTPIEVFPNLIINVTTEDKLSQQIHYIINREKIGVFHLGSTDLVHHEDFIKEIVESLGEYKPIYKHVYTTNDNRYLAVLAKHNVLPKNLQIKSQDVLKSSIL